MNSITKFTTSSLLNADVMNIPLYEIERNIQDLHNLYTTYIRENQNLSVDNQDIDNTTPSYSVVYFNNGKWSKISIDYLSEVPSEFPVGVVGEVSTYKKGRITFSGVISPPLNYDGSITIGVPYYLGRDGKITKYAGERNIHIGTYISDSTFILNIQLWLNAHIHQRIILDNWEVVDTKITHRLDQFIKHPVLVINGKYLPLSTKYSVDEIGIRIDDESYFTSLLSPSGTLFNYFSSSQTEMFYSDPKSVTYPTVITLTSGTDNILVTNKITGASSSTGELKVSCVPVINTLSNTDGVVSSVYSDSTGDINIVKIPVVERIKAGSNISLSSEQGTVTISSLLSDSIEDKFDDIFIKGSLFKEYPGTINTYIELTNTRSNSFTMSKILPTNIDLTKNVEIYAVLFGMIPGTVVLNDYICQPVYIGSSPLSGSISIPIITTGLLQKVLLRTFLPTSTMVQYNIGRVLDNSYRSIIGIVSLSLKYYVR